jgi:hypothetical protein
MFARLRSRLTYANVIASIALFMAMGGTGYAALNLPKASVGAKQLKAGSVTAKKVKSGAITSAKVKNGSLLGNDFRAGQLPAGAAGPQGPTGPQGPAGAPGDAVGFASVRADGLFLTDLAKNVTAANLNHTGPGIYCFSGMPFIQRSAVATSNGFVANDSDVVVNVTIRYSGPDCPGSFDRPTTRVATYDIGLGFVDRGFTIWFED